MFKNRENIRFIPFDAIIVMSILFLGILIYNNLSVSIPVHKSNLISTYFSLIGKSAVSSPSARLQVFQKTWISNKDNFNLLAFNRNPFSENKKTSIKVSHLLLIRQSSHKIPQFILRYHLFPLEADDLPYIS